MSRGFRDFVKQACEEHKPQRPFQRDFNKLQNCKTHSANENWSHVFI